MQKTRVFADTNVILEAFRTNCWKAISSHFAIETVEKCVEETLTGNPGDPRHISVPPADLNAGLAAQHPVTRKELAIACHNMGYDLVICELDKDYFDAGKARFENHIKQIRMVV